MFGFYEPLKDAFLWFINSGKLVEIDPIVLSQNNINSLIEEGRLQGVADDYRFSSPDKIFERTEGNNPSYEVAYVIDKIAKTKCKVIRLRSDNQVDLILLKKKVLG